MKENVALCQRPTSSGPLEKEESAVLEATFATAQVKLSLRLGWAKVDQYNVGKCLWDTLCDQESHEYSSHTLSPFKFTIFLEIEAENI